MRWGFLVCLVFAFTPGLSASPMFYIKSESVDENQKPIAISLPSPYEFQFDTHVEGREGAQPGKESIKLDKSDLLEELSQEPDLLEDKKDLWIDSRPPEDWEDLVSLSIGAMTGFLILPLQSVFEINDEFKLQEMSGLLFFFLPFKDYYLFQNCGGEEYLVAVSFKPTEETLERMLSLDEQSKLCPKVPQNLSLDES